MFQKQVMPGIEELAHRRIEKPAQSSYFNHLHNHFEILFFVTGEAKFNIDGQLFSPAPFDLLFIPPGTYHYLIPTEEVPYENYVIGFQPGFMAEEHCRKLFSPPLIINARDDAELLGYFARMDYYAEQYNERDFAVCSLALVRELLTYCSYRKDTLAVRVGIPPSHIDEIIAYINDNLEKPLNAECIAQKFLLSKSYIQNIFSQQMHIGLKKFIMQKKIHAARVDLSAGMSPSVVCEKYGFCDYSTFYRLYRKTFDASPGEKC